MRIALDFDGVIHDHKHPPQGKKMGPPMPGALEGVKALLGAGHDLTIFTARAGDVNVKAWLRYFGFPELPITNIKGDWDLMVDDNAVRFDHWPVAPEVSGPAWEPALLASQERSPSESDHADVVREV